MRQTLTAMLVLAGLTSPAAAVGGQIVGTATATVTGRVLDATGASLAGVVVAASSPTLMETEAATITGADGRYVLPALPPGRYTVTFARAGFRTATRTGLDLGLGFTATIDVTLPLASFEDRTQVDARTARLDAHATSLGARFDATTLANLPNARNMAAVLAATPGVFLTRFDVGGSAGNAPGVYSAYGTAGANRPMVEGINVSGLLNFGFVPSYGSFHEVAVGTGAHDVEWSAPGVQMQFHSKSGSNRYQASLYADREPRTWQAINIDGGQIRRAAETGASLVPQANQLWSYRDVDADVSGFIRPNALWWYASVRDQKTSARLVNFGSAPYVTALRNYVGKLTYRSASRGRVVAYGHAGRNEQPTRLAGFGVGGVNPASVINPSVESTGHDRAWAWVSKVEWNAVFADSVYVEIRAGQFGANRVERPNGTAPRFEDSRSFLVEGGNRDWQENFRRDQAHASLTVFPRGGFARHQLKLGGELLRHSSTEIWREAYPGNVLHVLQGGAPLEVYLFGAPSRSVGGLWVMGAYAGDSWRLADRLTANLGVRFDRYRLFLPEQSHPAGRFTIEPTFYSAVHNLIDWNFLSPRLGLAADLDGHGRALAKLAYRRYPDSPGTGLAANVNPNSAQWWRGYRWRDHNADGDWDAGEEGDLLAARGGAPIESLDPNLSLPSVNEVALSFERELPGGLAMQTGVVWRGERDGFQRQNANQRFSDFSVPVTVPDPGPDGLAGTADDGLPIVAYELRPELVGLTPDNIVRTIPGADADYWTWELNAARRLSGRWSLAASVAHIWVAEHASGYFGQTVRQNRYVLTPNDLLHTRAGRHEFRIWTMKIHGTFVGPWQVQVTPFLRHQSGQPFGRTVGASLNYGNIRLLAEPIGTRRMDHLTLVDVRIERVFRSRAGRRAAVFLDVFSLLNANPAQNISWASSTFLRPQTIVAPRIARIGVKLDW